MLRTPCILLHVATPHVCLLQAPICSLLHFVNRRLSIALHTPPPPPLRVSFYPAPTATASCPLLLTQQQRLLLLCLCARAHVMIAELTRSSTFSRQGPCHVLRHLLTSEAVTRCLFSKFDSSGPSRIATAAAAIKC